MDFQIIVHISNNGNNHESLVLTNDGFRLMPYHNSSPRNFVTPEKAMEDYLKGEGTFELNAITSIGWQIERVQIVGLPQEPNYFENSHF